MIAKLQLVCAAIETHPPSPVLPAINTTRQRRALPAQPKHRNNLPVAFVLHSKSFWNCENDEKMYRDPPFNGSDRKMMTIAIALFGTRVSPRFDCTQEFMLITTSECTVTDQHTESIPERMPLKKVRRLADLKVDTLVCGGVDESSREYLRTYGIQVLSNISGKVDEVFPRCLPSHSPFTIHPDPPNKSPR